MADLTARFARAHARVRTIAVTGTNGKTTTTAMIAAIVRASGEPDARVTTVGAFVRDARVRGGSATGEFLAAVEGAVEAGVRTVAVEMTSLALAGGVARRWPPHVAVFTNLTRDHFDYHPSPEAYLASKAQLFLSLAPGGTAILHAGDPSSALLAEILPRGVLDLRFGLQSGDLRADTLRVTADGTRFVTRASDAAMDGLAIAIAAIGEHHAENALAAALATRALGYGADAIERGLADFVPVPGRFEVIGHAPLVVVDYAHTPDGLEKTLATARGLVGLGGQLACVFGCGGERDPGKRPLMGALADRLADRVWLTNDNPRREDPGGIARAVREGAGETPRAHWIEELDRRRAIERAIVESRAADVVILAGRGHESHQQLDAQRVPLSDATVAREALARREHARSG